MFSLCASVSAAERQNVHIKTPGITVEIPGDAVFTVTEGETGELLNAADEKATYKITLSAEKSGDIFSYKQLGKDEIEKEEDAVKNEMNADKVTAYETNQAIFFDCINNTDKYLVSSTVVNGYKYQLKLSVDKRALTISDHGIFNTAARSIVFDKVENEPVEVNMLGNFGTVICIAIVILVAALIIALIVRNIKSKGKSGKRSLPDGAATAQAKPKAKMNRPDVTVIKHDDFDGQPEPDYEGDKPIDVIKPVKIEKASVQKSKKRDVKADDAAESFYEEIESDGLFDENADEEIPTQVQLDYIGNVPGDEEFKNTPVRMRVDIIKPVDENGGNADQSDLLELSRNNNEDYDEAYTDDIPSDDGAFDKVKGMFGKQRREQKSEAADGGDFEKTEPKRRERAERTPEERERAEQRRRRREEMRAERRGSSADSEFVKSFDNDSYWDKYR